MGFRVYEEPGSLALEALVPVVPRAPPQGSVAPSRVRPRGWEGVLPLPLAVGLPGSAGAGLHRGAGGVESAWRGREAVSLQPCSVPQVARLLLLPGGPGPLPALGLVLRGELAQPGLRARCSVHFPSALPSAPPAPPCSPLHSPLPPRVGGWEGPRNERWCGRLSPAWAAPGTPLPPVSLASSCKVRWGRG